MKDVGLKLLISASVFAIAVSAAPYSAKAQSDSAGGIEEITVTARKREEKLLDVPVAITAYSSKMIEDEGISSIADIAQFTPGMNFNANSAGSARNDRSFPVFIIRGMVPYNNSNPNTSIFVDGAPVSSGQVEGIDSAVDRIEVLKGPQSAYFGRSTFAGGINYITKDPSKDYAGDIDVLFGSRNWHDVRASLEGPIVEDKLSFRATFRDYSRDGSYGNQAPAGFKGSPNETLGDQSTRSGSFEAVLTPTDNFKVKAFGMMWADDDGPSAQGQILSKDPATGKVIYGNCFNNSYVCGTVGALDPAQPAANTQVDSKIQNFINQIQGPLLQQIEPLPSHYGLQRQAYHYSVDAEYYFESLGFTVTSLTSGNREEYSELQDLDNADNSNVPNPLAFLFPTAQSFYNWPFDVMGRNHDFSQELRIASDQDQRFRWLVGLNYEHVRNDSSLGSGGPFGFSNSGESANASTTEGVFYGLSYDIIPDLTLNFEGRYQVDEVQSFAPLYTQQTKGYVHSFIPRTSLQYKIDPDLMVYATYSEGVNPPVNNGNLANYTPAQRSYLAGLGATPVIKPESLKNYEAGVKGKFWGGRATLAADVYYDTWTNQIVSTTINLASATGVPQQLFFNTNIGQTTLKGIEAEATVAPIDHVVVDASGAVNESRIDHFSCGTCIGGTNVVGNQLPYTSKYSAHIGVAYTDALPYLTDTTWYARADYTYKSGLYEYFDDLAKTPSSNILNLKAGITYSAFKIEAFIDNVNNDTAYTSIQTDYDIASPAETFTKYEGVLVGLPNLRTFGGRVKYTFGEQAAAPAETAAYVPPPVVAPAPAKTARSYQVFFDFNKSDLTPQAVTIVDTAAKNAGPAKVTEIEVTGHTDTVGSDAYNMRLSRRRAESVAAELEKQGIPSSEIAIFAKGKKDLLVPTADGVKEPQNRRVQIVYTGGPSS
jgi:iron complex outermembrane receptor protein